MDIPPFNSPESCTKVLTAVPHLSFVWDFNHTTPTQIAGYKSLAHRVNMLHVSDTSLPETNYHWPLGKVKVAFADYLTSLLQANFNGSAILEIGGLPKSSGYSQDTNEALSQS